MKEPATTPRKEDHFLEAPEDLQIDDSPTSVDFKQPEASEVEDELFDSHASLDSPYPSSLRCRRAFSLDCGSVITVEVPYVASREPKSWVSPEIPSPLLPKLIENEDTPDEFSGDSEVRFPSSAALIEEKDGKSRIASAVDDTDHASVEKDEKTKIASVFDDPLDDFVMKDEISASASVVDDPVDDFVKKYEMSATASVVDDPVDDFVKKDGISTTASVVDDTDDPSVQKDENFPTVSAVEDPDDASGKKDEKSIVASVIDYPDDDSVSVDSPATGGAESSSFIVSIAGLVMRAIEFQFNLLIGIFSLPVWSLYYSFALVTNPIGTIRKGSVYFLGKFMGIGGVALKTLSPFLYNWLSDYRSFLKLTVRFSWGLLWSAYVCIVLFGLLVSSFVMSGLTMRVLVKEPLLMKDTLYFDYTKSSPAASFPITTCPDAPCAGCAEKIVKTSHSRVIPLKHKFHVTVSLTLPESDYNRNLGIFQVRVDCLSANGVVLATSKQPCMLPFKSEPIRLLLTTLKIVPLIAGYISESENLKLKIRDFTEGNIPTACLKVLIEPRAEFQNGGGIPEIYDASLLVESDLPLLKRLLWRWKKTMFIWTTMMFFMMGLMFTLCCTHCLLPRPTQNDSLADRSTSQHSIPVAREVR